MSTVAVKYQTAKVGPWIISKRLTADEMAKIRYEELKNSIYVRGIVPVSYFPSVNSMYGYNRWGGKFLLPELVELRKTITGYLTSTGLYNNIQIPEEPLTLTLGFFINQSINRRDYDNMIKFIQDTLAEYFKFNDYLIYDGRQFKRLVTNSDTEWLYFKIEKNKSNNFVIDKADLLSMNA